MVFLKVLTVPAASTTRLCTLFHRQQQIDEHFHFHDVDKHAASGNFIYHNYRQALEKIAISSGQLSHLESTLQTTTADYENYHPAEVQYFRDVRKEPEQVQHTVNYIEKLQKYVEVVAASDQAKSEFQRLDYNIVNNGYTKPQITLVRTKYHTTYTRLLAVEEDLLRYEEEHALGEVERLVVQRLLEMTKLGMNGLAYNLHEKISKALKTRSEAICHALITYNNAAAALSPPRERLSFAQVIHTTSLAEFNILRDTRQDIR
ncbi:hypothetical protein B0H14DRAFT_3447008 [Mycena olivaceomarginata]|nr:hypothetical protein B0H14DRAFT_3447008 [Mycena olivaceomarginata]